MIRHLSKLTRKATGRFLPSERVVSPKSVDDVSRPPLAVDLDLDPEPEPAVSEPVSLDTVALRAACDLTSAHELLIADRWVRITAAEPYAYWSPQSGRGRRWMQFTMADGSIVTEQYQELVESREAEETEAEHDPCDCGYCDDAADAARDMDRADDLIGGDQ